MIKKGMELEVIVEEAKFPNMGIVNTEAGELRIKGGVKGEKLLIRVSRKKQDYLEGKIIEVLEKSPLEIKAKCPHFGKCGGCTYQDMDYDTELEYKKEQVENLFKESSLKLNIKGIVGSPNVEDYRNKMEFTFGDEYKDGPIALGMHRKGKFYEIENVEHCNIADDDFTDILMGVLNYFKGTDLTFYNKRHHKGGLRNLVIRKSLSRNEILVNLVTTTQEKVNIEEFKDLLLDLELDGKIVGILHTLNDSVSDAIKVDKLETLWGQDFIVEEICGLKFKISPFSFFQTNTLAAEKLYTMTQDLIGNIDDLTVFDLYSGTGTIAQIMAKVAKEVVAIEIVEEAVEMARENAKINNLNNIEFIAGDMFKVIGDIDKKPDLIVIDPPRPGLEKAIDKIIAFNPKTFIYVSCNPKTMLKDLEKFSEAGYKIGDIQLVDQFPRTPHCEAMVRIER